MVNLQQIKQKQQELEQMISDLEFESEAYESNDDFPQLGQDYLYLDDSGDSRIGVNNEIHKDAYRVSIGNCFTSEKELEKYKLRLESMKPKYLPKVGDEFYGISYLPDESMIPARSVRRGGYLISPVYLLGRTFKTKSEAQEWINKYQDAWRL